MLELENVEATVRYNALIATFNLTANHKPFFAFNIQEIFGNSTMGLTSI